MSLVRVGRLVYAHTTPASAGSSATSKSRSVSALVHGTVPGDIVMAAPAEIQKRTDLLSDQSRLRPTVMAATIASPAPTPLTARMGIAENRRLCSAVAS